MIPDSVRDFLSKPAFATLVLAKDGLPHLFRCAGPIMRGDTLIVIVPPSSVSGIDAFPDGTQGAIVLGDLAYRAYQFKGRVRVRPGTPEECARGRAILLAMGGEVERMLGIPQDNYAKIKVEGGVAVELDVEHAFEQSPKPGTGARIGGGA